MKKVYARVTLMLFAIVAFIGVTCSNTYAANEWTGGNSIEVIGMGMAPPNAVNATHGKMLARRAAVADGYRQLAEVVKGVNVESGTDVEMMMLQSDAVKLGVTTVIKGAVVVDEKDLGEGGYQVTMRMAMFGDNSIAKVVMPAQNQAREPKEKIPSPPASVKGNGGYTGLIIDCRGLGLKPVMSPVVIADNGQKIYGYKNLDPDKVIAQGMADYSYDPNSGVSRAGSKPLIIKAVRVENHNGNPVISASDANKVLAENEISHFLENTNVVFIR